MTTESSLAEEEFSWATFINELPAYVRLALDGQAPEAVYPEWAFHIATSVECQAAYYQELRQQSLVQAVADTKRTESSKAMRLLRQFRSTAVPSAPPPAPSWLERVIEHGHAWIEAETEKWRRLQIALTGLQRNTGGSPALAGMMSEAGTAKLPTDALYVAPVDSGFEVAVSVRPQIVPGAQNTCQVEVLLTLHDRFGDYSGVDLILQWEDASREATTDRLGRAIFPDLPYDQVKAMNLIVLLPA